MNTCCGLYVKVDIIMRCFFWEKGRLLPGIQVLDRGHQIIIPLGSEPDSGRPRYLCLHKLRPPILREKRRKLYIDDAYPVSMQSIGTPPRTFFVLAEPHGHHEGDARILVQVSTYSDGAGPTSKGLWYTQQGTVETIEQGVQSNRKGQQWRVALLRMTPGDVVVVYTEEEGCTGYTIEVKNDKVTTPLTYTRNIDGEVNYASQ